MAEIGLSQEEIWDDSVLVKSWNEAFEEYKKYHSLAVKGEKVDLAAGKAEPQQPKSVAPPLTATGDAAAAVETKPAPANKVNGPSRATGTAPALAPPPPVSGTATLPSALTGTVNDENLKNIMMSWYYAGYYTGLYEGKQQAYAGMNNQGG